jgi:hypothetical protein
MLLQAGNQYRAYLESPDGSIIEMDAVVWDVSYHMPMDGMLQYEINLRGIGEPHTRKEMLDRIEVERTSEEWRCPGCARPNKRADEMCKSCGRMRSFLYG